MNKIALFWGDCTHFVFKVGEYHKKDYTYIDLILVCSGIFRKCFIKKTYVISKFDYDERFLIEETSVHCLEGAAAAAESSALSSLNEEGSI